MSRLTKALAAFERAKSDFEAPKDATTNARIVLMKAEDAHTKKRADGTWKAVSDARSALARTEFEDSSTHDERLRALREAEAEVQAAEREDCEAKLAANRGKVVTVFDVELSQNVARAVQSLRDLLDSAELKNAANAALDVEASELAMKLGLDAPVSADAQLFERFGYAMAAGAVSEGWSLPASSYVTLHPSWLADARPVARPHRLAIVAARVEAERQAEARRLELEERQREQARVREEERLQKYGALMLKSTCAWTLSFPIGDRIVWLKQDGSEQTYRVTPDGACAIPYEAAMRIVRQGQASGEFVAVFTRGMEAHDAAPYPGKHITVLGGGGPRFERATKEFVLAEREKKAKRDEQRMNDAAWEARNAQVDAAFE